MKRALLIALAALSLGAYTSAVGTRPGTSLLQGGAEPERAILGIHPGSPDFNVLLAEITDTVTDARAAGAGHFYFYRELADLDTQGTADVMALLGHPVAITLSIWNLSAIDDALPAACDPDWYADACMDTIAAKSAAFARRYLLPGDYFFVGNEQEEYFRTNTGLVGYHNELVLRVQRAVQDARPGVRVGPVLGHDEADETLLASLWDDRFSMLCLNAYGENADFTVTAPADGITALDDASDFAHTLTPFWGICETGYPSATVLGSSEADQATWAGLVRSWSMTTSARFVLLFIGLDGVLEADESSDLNDGVGAASSPCYNRAIALGEPDPSTSLLDTYICSLGLIEENGTKKDGWNALWGL